MGIRDWLRRLGSADEPPVDLPPRHERREEARERHAEGGPAWSPEDRHVNPDGGEVNDLAPGLTGDATSHRTVNRH